MKPILFSLVVLFIYGKSFSQKVDSIYFHLYTDSLKKGVHNYINVDGKLADGHWSPLTEKQIIFSSDFGSFEGNDLILPIDFAEEKVKVKALLKADPSIWKEVTIWIKKLPNPDKLPTTDDILNGPPSKRNKRN